MASLETRSATQNDFDFAWKVYSDHVKSLIAPHMTRAWIDADERSRFATLWKPQEAHIILLDGEPVGWFSCNIRPEIVEIEHGYILPAYQNRGIGGRILKFIYEEAGKQNKKVSFSTLKGDPAFRVYGRREFSIVSEDHMSVTVEITSI